MRDWGRDTGVDGSRALIQDLDPGLGLEWLDYGHERVLLCCRPDGEHVNAALARSGACATGDCAEKCGHRHSNKACELATDHKITPNKRPDGGAPSDFRILTLRRKAVDYQFDRPAVLDWPADVQAIP